MRYMGFRYSGKGFPSEPNAFSTHVNIIHTNPYICVSSITYKEVITLTCTFNPTTHAKTMMIERGISRTEAMEVINKGAKHIRKGRIISRLKHKEVVYIKKPCHFYVITLYWM